MSKKVQGWEPRGGEPLPPILPPSRKAEIAKAWIGRLPDFLLRPAGATLVTAIAFAIAFSGHSELIIRSVGILAFVLILILELWAWQLGHMGLWRFVIGWTGTSLLLIGVMSAMWWWLDGRLQDERDSVYSHLHASYQVGPPEDFPIGTLFTVTNTSDIELSAKHQLICYINAWGISSGIGMENAWEAHYTNPQTGEYGGGVGWGKQRLLNYRDKIPPKKVLKAGDPETDDCLRIFHYPPLDTKCIDLTIMFWYSLDTQPDIKQEKDFRYVGFHDESHSFAWRPEPVDPERKFCEWTRK